MVAIDEFWNPELETMLWIMLAAIVFPFLAGWLVITLSSLTSTPYSRLSNRSGGSAAVPEDPHGDDNSADPDGAGAPRR